MVYRRFESLWPVSGGMRERAKERKEVREETAHHRNLRGKTEREKGGGGNKVRLS